MTNSSKQRRCPFRGRKEGKVGGRARYSKGPQWHGTSVTLYIDSTVHFCPPVTSVSSVLTDCICKV